MVFILTVHYRAMLDFRMAKWNWIRWCWMFLMVMVAMLNQHRNYCRHSRGYHSIMAPSVHVYFGHHRCHSQYWMPRRWLHPSHRNQYHCYLPSLHPLRPANLLLSVVVAVGVVHGRPLESVQCSRNCIALPWREFPERWHSAELALEVGLMMHRAAAAMAVVFRPPLLGPRMMWAL